MADDADELPFATAGELAQLLDSGRISSVELSELFLQRLATLGPNYNAVAAITYDRAKSEARRADARRKAGATAPLLGIPYGVKDLLAAQGFPTTYGSPIHRNQMLDHDAACIERLERHGSVLAAKLSTMEFAALGATNAYASWQGPSVNPWDRSRWAGGSSSGSAAAVAAGLVPFALATETGGSIGSPSAFCGITAIRPTYGLVSRYGAMILSWTLDKIGPMARSASDCATVLEVISGPDARDSASTRLRFRRSDLEKARGRGLSTYRVAFAPADFEENADPELRPALRQGLAAVRDLGVLLSEAELPRDLPYKEVISNVMSAEAAASLSRLIEGPEVEQVIDAQARAAMRASLLITARDYLGALRLMSRVQVAFSELFQRFDALVTYTLPWEPPPIEQAFQPIPITGGFSGMVYASNLAGLPAVFLPCGLTEKGLPVGMQLVGPPFSEAALLIVAEALQKNTDWHRLHPPVHTSDHGNVGGYQPILQSGQAASQCEEAGGDDQIRAALDAQDRDAKSIRRIPLSSSDEPATIFRARIQRRNRTSPSHRPGEGP